MATPAATQRLIGAIFIERGLITEADLERALELQAKSGERLGEILVAHFGISRLELASVLAEQWSDQSRATPSLTAVPDAAGADAAEQSPGPEEVTEATEKRPIGEIFVERGLVTQVELDQALEAQRASGERLGEILVAQGVVTRLELASALAEQWAGVQRLRPPSEEEPVERRKEPDTAGDTDVMVSALRGLEARLSGLEGRAGAGDRSGAEVTADAVAPILARLEGLEQAVAAIRDRGPADDAAHLADRVSELAAGLADVRAAMESALHGLEQRVDAIPEPATALQEDLVQRVRLLGASVDEVRSIAESAVSEMRTTGDLTRAEEWRMREELDVLQQRVDELGSTAAGPSATHDVSAELKAIHESTRAALDELSGRLDALPAGAGESTDDLARRLSALENGLTQQRMAGDQMRTESWKLHEELASLKERIEALPAGTGGGEAPMAEIEQLQAQMLALASTHRVSPDQLEARLGSLRGALEPVVEELRVRVDALEGDGGEKAGEESERIDALAASLDELTRQVQALSAAQTVSPDQLAAAIDDMGRSLAAGIDDVRGQVLAVTATAGQVPEALGERVGVLAAALDELGARVDSLSSAPRLSEAELTAGLEAVRDSVAAALQELRSRLDVAEASIDFAAGGPVALEQHVDALRASLEELRAQVGDLAAARTVSPEQLAAGLDDVRGALVARIAEIRERVETGSTAPGEVPPEIEERVTLLTAVIGELRTRIEDQAARGGVTPEQLGAAVAELRTQLEQSPSTDTADELRALSDRVAEIAPALERLPELESHLTALAGRVDDLHALERAVEGVHELGSVVVGLQEALAELHGAVASRDDLDALAGQLAALAQRPGIEPAEWRAELAAYASGLEELRVELDRLASRQHVSPEQLAAALEAHRGSGELASSEEIDDLAARLAGLEQLSAAVTELQSGLQRLQSPHGERRLGELQDATNELFLRLAALGERVDQVDALRAKVGDVEELAAASAALPEQLASLREGLDRAAAVGEEVASLAVRLTVLEQRPTDGPDHEVRGVVDALAARLEDVRARAGDAASRDVVTPDELAAALEASQAPLAERVEGLSRRLEKVASRVKEGSGSLAERVEELGRSLDELRHAANGTVGREQLEAVEQGLHELSAVVGASATAMREETGEAIEGLREELGRLAGTAVSRDEHESLSKTLEALAGIVSAGPVQVDALATRLDELEQRVAAGLGEGDRLNALEILVGEFADRFDARAEEIGHHLSTVQGRLAALDPIAERLEAVEAGVRDAVPADALDRLAAAVGGESARSAELRQRVESLECGAEELRAEAAVSVDSTQSSLDELQALVDSLGAHVQRSDALAREQARAAEKAVKKGLRALARRVAEGETTYRESGDAMTRTIEGLTGALRDLESEASSPGDVARNGAGDGWVAFAPTSEGYRLVTFDGQAPAMGEMVILDESGGAFVAVERRPSPLPFDSRPCVVLERPSPDSGAQ